MRELNSKEIESIGIAVSSLYYRDNSKYDEALLEIIKVLLDNEKITMDNIDDLYNQF